MFQTPIKHFLYSPQCLKNSDVHLTVPSDIPCHLCHYKHSNVNQNIHTCSERHRNTEYEVNTARSQQCTPYDCYGENSRPTEPTP